jgi:hypothetical protein
MTADPYDEFLDSADIPTWQRCLDRLTGAVGEPGDVDHERLAQAMCVAAYLVWLGRISGDTRAGTDATARLRRLRSVLMEEAVTAPVQQLRLCWGIALAHAGYRRRPRALLERDGQIAGEHLLLASDPGDADLLAGLRGACSSQGRRTFLPVLHRYAGELAQAGRVAEARDVVTSSGWDATEPLVLDLLGRTSEQLGRWAEAHGAYTASSWLTHRYRSLVTGTILGLDHADADAERYGPDRKLPADSFTEINEREIPGRVAFLNACLWRPIDGWVVHWELGKLGFRRRRHIEADVDLARAERIAPQSARFAITELRFANLTWMSWERLARGTRMLPEALSAGRAALAASTGDDDIAELSTWLAGVTYDGTLIAGDRSGWDHYYHGYAHQILGDTASAIDSWFAAFRTTFNHRAGVRLIDVLSEAGFARTATHLARLVLEEFPKDFFALWETAEALYRIADRVGPENDPGDELEQVEDRYWERLLELSRLEFKNGIRLIQLADVHGLRDLIEELFLQVAKQAEGVSEFLAVVVLRRRVTGWPNSSVQQEVRWCLAQARNAARTRQERLEIARELFHCGQHGEAHDILAAERVTAQDTELSHAEMVAALQCGAWLTPDERTGLAERAVRQLNLDHLAGALGPDAYHYAERLRLVGEENGLTELDSALHPGLLTRSSPPSAGTRSHGAASTVMEVLDTELRTGGDLTAWARTTFASDALTSIGVRLVMCSRLRALLVSRVKAIRAQRPEMPEDGTPIRMGADDNTLVIQLCDAWRARLGSSGAAPDLADSRIRDLQAADRERERQWEMTRRRDTEPWWRGVKNTAEALSIVLSEVIGPAEKSETNPVLVEIIMQIRRDVAALTDEASEQIRLTGSAVTDPDGPP